MQANERDIFALERILKYCDDIDATNKHFGSSLEKLQSDDIYLNALAMCVLQIGELTTHLTDDFKEKYTDIPWIKIKAMRNIAVHRYGEFSISTLWETITDDIPSLRAYCTKCLNELEKHRIGN
jgi:uncharacterized protein with HEPN domain